MTGTSRTVLLISQDAPIVQLVRRVSRPRFLVRQVKSAEQTVRAIVQSFSYDCAIVSSRLGARDGFVAAVAVRKARAALPILVLGCDDGLLMANEAFGLQAGFVVPTHDLELHLTAFLRRVSSRLVYVEQARYIAFEAFASTVGLSIREAEVLAAAESGVPRGRIADTLGIAENTVKTHVRAILRKTNHSSLSEVVWMLRNAGQLAPGAGTV